MDEGGLYLYCAVPAGHAPPTDLRGLDDAPVRAVETGGLAVWATPLPRAPMPAVDAIQRHNAVIEAALTPAVTPVPLRFGQFVATEAALHERAAERAGEWAAQLAEFAGRVEYGVRAIDPARAVTARDVRGSAPSGRAYLEALARAAGEDRDRRARAEALAGDIGTRLGGLIAKQHVEPLPSTHGLASIAHLVRHEDAAAYGDALAAAFAAMPHLRFLRSGPWPPYSFAK